jgi:hypothetical protein
LINKKDRLVSSLVWNGQDVEGIAKELLDLREKSLM